MQTHEASYSSNDFGKKSGVSVHREHAPHTYRLQCRQCIVLAKEPSDDLQFIHHGLAGAIL